MGKFKDLTNQKFEKLLVLYRIEKPSHLKQRGVCWMCRCDCGNEIPMMANRLMSGNSKSCGCLRAEMTIRLNKINKKKYNTYDLTGEYGVGYTTKGEEFYFDLEDHDKIKDYCWRIHNRGYVACCVFIDKNKKKDILLHRIITDCPEDLVIDHINGLQTRHDNRKYNLRICTRQQNICNYTTPVNNTSGFKGVSWDNTHNKWKAFITFENKRINLGSFVNKEDAIKVRQEAEIKYFKEFRNIVDL